jgi:uncharacterized protein YbaA (DUF1428 family)
LAYVSALFGVVDIRPQVHVHGLTSRSVSQGDLVVFRMPVRLQADEELVVHVQVVDSQQQEDVGDRHVVTPISIRPIGTKKRLRTRRTSDLEHNHQKSAPCTPSCPAHDGR